MIPEKQGMPDPAESGSQNEEMQTPSDTAAATLQPDDAATDVGNGQPLPKIHPNLHGGRYKMFSNHSSANDIPGTTTGI